MSSVDVSEMTSGSQTKEKKASGPKERKRNELLISRLQYMLDLRHLSPSRACLQAGLERTYLNSLFDGRKQQPGLGNMQSLAKVLQCDLSWLAGGPGAPELDDMGSSPILELDLRAGMGGAGVVGIDYEYVEGKEGAIPRDSIKGKWSFPGEYMRFELRADPKHIRIFEVQGDSMYPTLMAGDRVMVDTQNKSPTPPGIMALDDGLGVVVKRVERVPNTDPVLLNVKSDNPQHAPYQISLEEARPLGRVIWYARRL